MDQQQLLLNLTNIYISDKNYFTGLQLSKAFLLGV